MNNPGWQAFPNAGAGSEGLTKREWLYGQILNGLLAGCPIPKRDIKEIIELANKYTDESFKQNSI